MTRNEHGQMFVILISELHTNSKIIHIPDSLISDICDPITTTKTPNQKEKTLSSGAAPVQLAADRGTRSRPDLTSIGQISELS